MEAATLIQSAYLAILGVLGLYGLHRLVLVVRFRWGAATPTASGDHGELPFVTVQLPLFNERTVAARLIRATGALDYPSSRFEIQVLDDSTDETTEIARREIELLARAGRSATLVRRADRTGFKAGALDYGMREARGELFCVFDADFMPEPDFLLKTVAPFSNPRVGMVQARWGHANREESLLTRAESTLLDGHFVIEHKTRFDTGLFFNFNGTAGVWRRAAIDGAGGWQHDTLTEDLDLSYRAQLAGWRFVYASDVVAPAEVPPGITAFKSQQHRWSKGSVQVFKKLGRRIASSPQPLRVKLEAFAHLTGNVGYPGVLLLALLLPLASALPVRDFHLWQLSAFVLCTLSVGMFYEASQRAIGRPFGRRLRDTVAAIALGIGMSLAQTGAVLEGLVGKTGTFVRTPKRGDGHQPGYRARRGGVPGLELVLALWFVVGLVLAARAGNWGSLPFLALFLWSYTWVGVLSLREARAARATMPA
ncbi:MAG: glycosyltransferase [bacterium]|nr:glycosyltransferase [bacterium]